MRVKETMVADRMTTLHRLCGDARPRSGPWDDVVSNRSIVVERWTERLRRNDAQLDRMAVDGRASGAAAGATTRRPLHETIRCVP